MCTESISQHKNCQLANLAKSFLFVFFCLLDGSLALRLTPSSSNSLPKAKG